MSPVYTPFFSILPANVLEIVLCFVDNDCITIKLLEKKEYTMQSYINEIVNVAISVGVVVGSLQAMRVVIGGVVAYVKTMF